MTLQRWHIVLVLAAIVAVAIFPRVLDLDATRSPDEKRWVANTSGFTNRLAHGELLDLVQQPHPGITTQWLGALAIRATDRATQKLPLALGQAVLILIAGYIYGRAWRWQAGALVAALLALNPVLLAHTRVYAMDSLLSLFLVISIGLLLLWRKNKNWIYLAAAAAAGAAATLSKLPGVMIIPSSALVVTYWIWRDGWSNKAWLRAAGIWALAFIIAAGLILPSLALHPAGTIGSFAEMFRSDEYLGAHYQPASYYLETLLFFSLPVHIAAAAALLWLWLGRHISGRQKETAVVLLFFAALFVIEMMMGLKKGDRYILPAFLFFDIIAAYVFYLSWQIFKTAGDTKKQVAAIFLALIAAATVWQAIDIWRDHTNLLAYTNPITRPLFPEERRHGWGEGLSAAAEYLNNKPNAEQLKVASYFPNEFEPYFGGETTAAHKHEDDSVDYVVIYRAMIDRGDRWESDLINYYRQFEPEHTVILFGLELAWIYPTGNP